MADEVPEHFRCPITQEVMEYPFTTSAGNSYEYEAIAQWLHGKSLDPLSGVQLADKGIVPNNNLRSQILEWFEDHPECAHLRNTAAVKPPPEAYSGGGARAAAPGLDKILRYRGQESRKKGAAQHKAAVPQPLTAFGHLYEFSEANRAVYVRCDGGPWVEMPDDAMFPTAQGVVFYDPTETRETRVLPGTDAAELCKFSARCTKATCPYAHPFACTRGVTCRDAATCKFLHPDAASVVPLGAGFPRSKECRYGTACSNKGCGFAHPNGRMTVARLKARVFATHSLTLQELPAPIPIMLEVPDHTTRFQYQGEFAFCFEPYPGPWAKEHYKTVLVYRFDPHSQAYMQVGDYALEKHYCNCAVGAGRYLVISFWPYEEEALRTIWECLRVGRAMEKELGAKTKEIDSLKGSLAERDGTIAHLNEQIAEKDRYIAHLRSEIERLRESIRRQASDLARAQYAAQKADRARAAAERREAWASRRAALAEQRRQEQSWRITRQNQERARNERLRLRDPIHIYALQHGRSGFSREDWQLVLDYHKGAHAIRLGEAQPDGAQTLELTEYDNVFRFDLVVPTGQDLRTALGAALPVVPGRLCADF